MGAGPLSSLENELPLNKPCLLELSWSVTSILCYDEMRTEGEKLT